MSSADDRNLPERLDPALSRAGRFDVRLTFSNAIPAQARALFLHFYPLADFLQINHADDTSREKASVGITSQSDLEAMADDFATVVFPTGKPDEAGGRHDVGVSMAALQGYLLQYKEDPRNAVEDAGGWARTLEKEKEVKKAAARSALGAPPVTPVVTRAAGAVGKVPLRKRVLQKNSVTGRARKQAAEEEEVSEEVDEGSGESVAEE
jgi:chaperone BCS1